MKGVFTRLVRLEATVTKNFFDETVRRGESEPAVVCVKVQEQFIGRCSGSH